jgi:hypothetical protein
MMPGRIEYFDPPKCPECHGWDVGNVGVVHHKRDCSRNGCLLCHNAIHPDEKRTRFPSGEPVHYDCLVEWELNQEPPSGFKDSRGVEY